jgi:hypothetical protein
MLLSNEEIRAVRITVTGDFEGISLDRTQHLQSLYTTIDCRYVEVVQPTETICLWVDEEGLRNRSDPNLLATLLAAELGSFGQVLRGTVVVTGGSDGAGDTLPLSDQDLLLLEAVVDRISGVGQKRGSTFQP